MTMSLLVHRVCGWVVLAGLFAAPLLAQSFTGAITGTVTDPSNAAVAGVKLVAVEERSNVSNEAVSDVRGDYVFPSLRPGLYRVEVESPGFHKIVRSGIEVRVNDRLELNFALTVGSVSESLQVKIGRAHV